MFPLTFTDERHFHLVLILTTLFIRPSLICFGNFSYYITTGLLAGSNICCALIQIKHVIFVIL